MQKTEALSNQLAVTDTIVRIYASYQFSVNGPIPSTSSVLKNSQQRRNVIEIGIKVAIINSIPEPKLPKKQKVKKVA